MNKATSGIIIAVLSVVVFSIYWFGIRPGEVRKDCWEQAQSHASKISASEAVMIEQGSNLRRADYEKVRDDGFKSCLLEHGLAK
ncbi:MAG: hypothetical protein AUK58_00960 [Candidatus Moranbacteria bacterium CG2_30_41_165]|nr:MAG: hypothetical protein AUK58_00960 [Candidatus Moranbacteria bacterium CG2_30_41_165]PIV85899.1 MAG: hypothetical protein COW50_04470 [Candidatus Moranbacteria bacterium CG17_big_fil_post_rev_8_21_14_2_50_41_107]